MSIYTIIEYFKILGYKEIRLGYVSGNKQSEHFWLKNGFKKTNLISKEELYDVVILNRIL